MPDPIDPTSLVEKIAFAVTVGAMRGWSLYGPELIESSINAWRRAWQTTITQSPPVPQDFKDAADKELTDAMADFDARKPA
jgi:hypothetical protein